MSRIPRAFARPSRKALIAYVTVGYPSVEATLNVVPLLADGGCDLVELGIPFSDPLADGVTIQKASFQALQNGVTPAVCLDVARRLTEKVDVPLVFMTYYNPILRYGHETFCHDCAKARIDGLIIPDLPPDESQELEAMTQKNGLDLIYLLAPTSTDERIMLAAGRSRGFVYLTSVAGVTGARDELPPGLGEFATRVRHATTLPLCVGFGISNARQASQVAGIADGVIVGSRIVNLMGEGSTASLQGFIRELRSAIDR
jgi:tryptophan synthase alpha chain